MISQHFTIIMDNFCSYFSHMMSKQIVNIVKYSKSLLSNGLLADGNVKDVLFDEDKCSSA